VDGFTVAGYGETVDILQFAVTVDGLWFMVDGLQLQWMVCSCGSQ
jgi:hypothetical protein